MQVHHFSELKKRKLQAGLLSPRGRDIYDTDSGASDSSDEIKVCYFISSILHLLSYLTYIFSSISFSSILYSIGEKEALQREKILRKSAGENYRYLPSPPLTLSLTYLHVLTLTSSQRLSHLG